MMTRPIMSTVTPAVQPTIPIVARFIEAVKTKNQKSSEVNISHIKLYTVKILARIKIPVNPNCKHEGSP